MIVADPSATFGRGFARIREMLVPAGFVTRTAVAMTLSMGPDFPVSIDDRYFEDYQPGAIYEYGEIKLSEPDIIEFAQQFDPQPMHIDPDGSAAGPYGGVIASGWHTTAVMMRLYADHYISRVASIPSPGIDELRWHQPVRPGDSLRLRVTINEARRSASKADRGLVRTRAELINQDGDTVLSLIAMNLLLLRHP